MRAQAGIHKAIAGMKPADKLAEVRSMCREGPTGMLGDGVNDAPALASGDLGIAMGAAGSEVAIHSASYAYGFIISAKCDTMMSRI